MIGFTAPIPLEILIAAGRQPVDLRQLFLAAENPAELIEEAELAGFPAHGNPWLKGLYGCVLRHGIREVITVTDSLPGISDLAAMLQLHDVRVVHFSFPADRSTESLALEIKKLARQFGAAPVDIDQTHQQLNQIRLKVHELDRLCWEELRGTSRQAAELQLATSDMQGDPQAFEALLDSRLARLTRLPGAADQVRLAFLGEPPLCDNLYETLDELGARVVFSESGRQSSMPSRTDSLVEQYRQFTLPYDIFTRMAFCQEEISRRQVDGLLLLNSDPSDCGIEEMLIRQQVQQPLLVLHNSRPGNLDAASRIRLERFLGMLHTGNEQPTFQ